MDRIQSLSFMLSMAFFIQVFVYIRRQQFRERQAFLWLMLASAGVLTAACIPLLNGLAGRLGVAYMPALVFVVAFYAVLTLLMLHAASVSREQEKLKVLVQEMACLRQELDELKAGLTQQGEGGLRL